MVLWYAMVKTIGGAWAVAFRVKGTKDTQAADIHYR